MPHFSGPFFSGIPGFGRIGDLFSRHLAGLPSGQWCLLTLFALALYMPHLGSARALTEHEIYVAGTSKQMVQEGNWIAPKVGDQFWIEKPPLPHWLEAASAAVFGGFSEAAVRAPSVLAGVAVVLVVTWISARLFGPQIGLLAGIVQAGSQYMIAYARLAEADMLLLLFVMLAVALFVYQRQMPDDLPPAKRRASLLLFWSLVGLMNLVKGPLFGSVLTLVTCGGWLVACRDWQGLRRFWSPLGILLAVAIGVAWPVLVFIQQPGALELWNAHLFGRAAGELGYSEPFYYYLTTWPTQLLPWTPILFFGAGQSLRRAYRDLSAPDGFVWWWALSQLALLSLSSGKHHHYLIYALPAMSPVIGLGLLRCANLMTHRSRFALHWGRFLTMVAFPLSIVGGIVGGRFAGEYRSDVHALCGLLAAGVFTLGVCNIRGLPKTALASFALLLLLGNTYIQGRLMPQRDRSAADRAFLLAVDRELPPGQPVIATGGGEISRHIFYLQRDVRGIWDPADVAPAIDQTRAAYVVTRERNRPQLESLGHVVQLRQSVYTRREQSPRDRFTLFRIDPARIGVLEPAAARK